jgi:hypothetical protein
MSARDAAGGLSAADASPAPPHLLLPRCAAQLTNIRAASLDLHRPRFGLSLLRDDLCRPPSTPAHLPHTDSPQATIKTPVRRRSATSLQLVPPPLTSIRLAPPRPEIPFDASRPSCSRPAQLHPIHATPGCSDPGSPSTPADRTMPGLPSCSRLVQQ